MHTSHYPRFAAAIALAAFATTSLVPAARAQDKAPAEAQAGDKAAAPAAKPAPAKPPDKKTRDAARKAYGDGEKAFAAGDFAAALEGFSKANELIPSPHALYWIGKCLDGQNKTEDAIKAYETFLADPEHEKAGEDKVADAKARADALKATLVGEVNVDTVPMGATVSVDGTPQMGETPMILKLSPGSHKLTVSSSGYETKEIDIEVKGGERLDQKIELVAKPPPPPEPEPVAEPAPAPAPPPAPPPEKRSKVPAYVTLGIASAGAIVGTIFGIQALSSKSDFDSNPTGSAADETERNALIADMAFGVAITLGVTGVVLLTSSDDSPKAASLTKLPARAKLNVAPYVTKEGGGAAARLTF